MWTQDASEEESTHYSLSPEESILDLESELFGDIDVKDRASSYLSGNSDLGLISPRDTLITEFPRKHGTNNAVLTPVIVKNI